MNDYTVTVSWDGSADFRSVSEALASSPPPNRIIVRPGFYRESLVVDRNVELIGEATPEKHKPSIGADDKHALVVQSGEVDVRGIRLDRIDVANDATLVVDEASVGSRVQVSGGASARFRRTSFHGPVEAEAGATCEIEDCHVGDGIRVDGAELVLKDSFINVHRDSIRRPLHVEVLGADAKAMVHDCRIMDSIGVADHATVTLNDVEVNMFVEVREGACVRLRRSRAEAIGVGPWSTCEIENGGPLWNLNCTRAAAPWGKLVLRDGLKAFPSGVPLFDLLLTPIVAACWGACYAVPLSGLCFFSFGNQPEYVLLPVLLGAMIRGIYCTALSPGAVLGPRDNALYSAGCGALLFIALNYAGQWWHSYHGVDIASTPLLFLLLGAGSGGLLGVVGGYFRRKVAPVIDTSVRLMVASLWVCAMFVPGWFGRLELEAYVPGLVVGGTLALVATVVSVKSLSWPLSRGLEGASKGALNAVLVTILIGAILTHMNVEISWLADRESLWRWGWVVICVGGAAAAAYHGWSEACRSERVLGWSGPHSRV